MRDPEETTRRTIEMPEHEITTHVEYSLIEGKYVVVLNPDADMLPSRVKLYLPRETSQALARDLAEQQAEADRRNEPEVEWAGRTFGQLTADEKARATRQAAGQLQAELQAAAPAIAQVLDEADRADRAAAVEQFLADQLARDDMTLAEIAAGAVAIATGASTFEPEPEPARFTVAQLEAGCPVCGTEEWGFVSSRDEAGAQGPACCSNGHEWTVTAS